MFKLSVSFENLNQLAAFVEKMGDKVVSAVVEQADASETTQAKAPSRSKPKAKVDVVTAEVGPNFPSSVHTPSAPFPGGFAPGNIATPVAAQPVHQPAPVVVQPTPVAAPVAQAPIAQPESAASPERLQYNDGCAKLIGYLEAEGSKRGLAPEQMGQIITGSITQAGIALGTRIPLMTDAQIQAFYPILHANILAAVPQQ